MSTMNLTALLKPWVREKVPSCVIKDIKNDSRQITKGDLFIAYPGAAADGRLFIDKAINAGAEAVIYDPLNMPLSVKLPSTVPCIAIAQLTEKLASIAQRFYGDPSLAVSLVGVTGTNGKTSIAYQLAQADYLLQRRSAYIGTIGQGEVSQLQPLDNTTPDALCLQKLLAGYKQKGIERVFMEVSSHALSQHRVDTLAFKQAIFTNLTLDHLDFHHTMEEYAAAKAKLFANEALEWVIINQDDDYHHLMEAAASSVKKMTYSLYADAMVKAVRWQMDMTGTVITVRSPWGEHKVKVQSLGLFNIYNSLAIFSSLMLSGYAIEQVIDVMVKLKAAPGRMEILAKTPYIVVDYAHTPDALKNVLITLNQLKKGKLWVVFGCGGNRDKSKRPIMGKIAGLHADKIVLTSDNPRNEDPEVIIDEIASGIPATTPIVKVTSRKTAIAYALNQAAAEDIILVAGKGHEAYQQIGLVKHAFSDQKFILQLLNK